MVQIIKYRNRIISPEDLTFIKSLIKSNPDYGRCALSRQICRSWNWIQPNGQLKDMICRGLLLHLERQGYLQLPPRKYTPHNPFLTRKKPEAVDVDKSLINANLKAISPITIKQVRRSTHERLFNSLIDEHHYLGYRRPVGEHLKYIAFCQNRPIACLAFASAAWHLGCRDRFIGWSPEQRQDNLHLLAYNNRFLILPWVRVSHLASHLLKRCAKIISCDWQHIYNHPLYWLETIVDTQRFKGTCYRAANWVLLGPTTGRGLNDQSHKRNRSIKSVYGYALVKNFRQKLGVAQ